MRRVFVDTFYLIAHLYPRDPWHRAARLSARTLVGDVRLIVTHEILIEFLSGMSATGHYYRDRAVAVVQNIHANPRFEVLPWTEDRYWKGIERYSRRSDKSYSLVDCISMVAMEEEGITEVLTGDLHFRQEGFTLLIQ